MMIVDEVVGCRTETHAMGPMPVMAETVAVVTGGGKLLEKLSVNFLDKQGLLNPTADAMANYRPSELHAVDEDNPFAQQIGCVLCRW